MFSKLISLEEAELFISKVKVSMCKIAKIWKLVFKRLLWRHADFWGHLNSPSHYILKHYFLPITSPPPKSKLIALIELYHLKISNVIWERQEVEFCTSHKKLSRLTSTRSLFCREKNTIINNKKTPKQYEIIWVVHILKIVMLRILGPAKSAFSSVWI